MPDPEDACSVDQKTQADSAETEAVAGEADIGPAPMDLQVIEPIVRNKLLSSGADYSADEDIADVIEEDPDEDDYVGIEDGQRDGDGVLEAGLTAADGAHSEEPLDEDKSTSSPCSVPDSAAGFRDRDLQALEIERACMEAQGQVSVKWDITRKNKNSIVINGYKMTESRAGKDGRVFWRCSKRFCSATAISLGSRLLSVRQVDERRFHNHPPTGKEEFFRGDFSSPGTPTGVTVKWPVLRASSKAGKGLTAPQLTTATSEAPPPPPPEQHRQLTQTPKASLAATMAADAATAATAAAVALQTAASAQQIQPQNLQYQQHQHQQAKRMRRGSLESGGSSTGTGASETAVATAAAALADPLCPPTLQQRQQPQMPPVASGGSMSDAHKAFLSLASNLGVMPYPGLFPNSLVSEAMALQQQQHTLQQQQHQQNYLSNHLATTKAYHSIFNPPPPQQQQPTQPPPPLHPDVAGVSAGAAAHDSPLKEALSQVDNYQLQRQLRRLDGYFRSGIVSLADTILRRGGTGGGLVAKDAEFVAWERDSMTRLFAYMDGLERVHKLSNDIV